MSLIDLEELKKTTGSLIGVDPGTKTLGIASSDITRLIATPFTTIKRTKFSLDAEKLFSIYDQYKASAIIMGLPINMNGSYGPRSQSVKDFCSNLIRVRNIPIFLWDERLSTLAVKRGMIDADLSREKQKKNVDKLAAAYILQGLLDRLRAN
ncbi:Holliday junction resolvase RuvX [Hellea sp.]|jgi:putative Holliday junction resolvase|nr:Holliday junction resolvase RuvX [Hellea sp.]MBT3593572.1 Holliday junction resolvase RuvX [Hellea sp.]MBT5835640.1 Holliday junction resolvase RuvX [Hellea sp.]MBT7398259.1 Holliday junction resolvase RuvX [Hellea sp.]MDB4844561.1 Holliday junction resolvase RuvX [Hellea sp.]MDC0422190.1 Holliday junction resolvase RuvX [Hellea sp.]